MRSNLALKHVITMTGLFVAWQAIVMIFAIPGYILPAPTMVIYTLYHHSHLLFMQTLPTLAETLLGFSLGVTCGFCAACVVAYSKTLARWFLPMLIISQAIPVFAIAPLLVIWFGYGISSKIAATIIMIFFPVTSATYDGLKNTKREWLELASTMNASKWRTFCHIRLPAALPNVASGIRIAAVIAPIGAIVGEWVGSSRGLGFLMMNANARLQVDMMFAALLVIIVMSLILYVCIDRILSKLIWW